MDSLMTGPVLAGLLLASFIYYNLKKFSFWSSRNIKGPTPWPFFGTNIYYIFQNKLDVDQKWRDKYGHTYGIYEGYEPTLRTTDNELIKHVFIKDFNNFTDRNSKLIFSDQQRKWLLWSPGEYWANQRPLISPMFTSSRMRSMFKSMSQCMDNFTTSIVEKKMGSEKGAKVYQKRDVGLMALDVISRTFFGLNMDLYREKSPEFLKEAFKLSSFDVPWFVLWSLIPKPIASYFQIDLFRQSRMEYFYKLSENIIKERRSQMASDSNNNDDDTSNKTKKNDFIQALLDARLSSEEHYEKIFSKEDDASKHFNDQIGHEELEKINELQTKKAFMKSFGEEEIKGQMTFLFIAGFETTAQSITFAIYELAHRPSDQQLLLDEIKRELDIGADGKIDNIDHADLMKLHQLDAFLSEVLRLYAPIVENNRLVTRKGGVELPLDPPIWLPERTSISVNSFTLQRDKDYWPKASEFDMSRFLPENKGKIVSCSYMPFGLGPRNCAGMRFALMEIKLALIKLITKYNVSPSPKTSHYPPKFVKNPVFLQMPESEFQLVRRGTTS